MDEKRVGHFGLYILLLSLANYSLLHNLLDLFNSEHAEKFGFGVVDRFVGHGVGTIFHSEPLIFHSRM